jgi:uncharacterized protein YbaR (Trm112 family)
MSLFNCPRCRKPYGLLELVEEEAVLLEDPMPLADQSFTLTCVNCLDQFKVHREVTVRYQAT